MPFSGAPQPPPNLPPQVYTADQPPPPPQVPVARAGYHDRTFTTFGQPITGGFTLERARAACRLHRQGFFLESYLFAVASLSFGPVFAALAQRIAPAMAQPKFVRGGSKGLAREIREQVEAQLAPRAGLSASVVFPAYLWGSISICVALMGFAVLQHVLGDEDEDGIRPVYTRLWPIWAVRYDAARRTFYAITNDGDVPILNDGKFTLIADTEDPHLWCAAILALADPVMQGIQATQARASYVQLYGNPKLVGTMPPKVAVRSDEGNAFFEATQDVRNQDGVIILANGAELDFVQLAAETSKVFVDTDENVWKYIAAILLGSDGTISKSGVYQSPDFAGVRHDIVARVLGCAVRGVNEGHVKTFVYFNWSASIERDKARGTWADPVLEIPLPDPAADARRDSLAKRMASLSTQVAAERAAGAIVDQGRVNVIAAALEVEPFILAEANPNAAITVDEVTAKLFAPDEYRAQSGRDPLPDDAGSVKRLATERLKGGDESGALAKVEAAEVKSDDTPDGGGPPNDAHRAAPSTVGVSLAHGSLRVGAYSDDQERAADGKFGSGAGGKSAASKSARGASDKAHKASDKADKDGSHGAAQKAHREAAGAHRDAAASSRKPEHKKAHADAAKAHDDKADEHAGKDPPLGGGTVGGKGKASKAAQEASKSASAASSAAKSGGSHEDAATAHADAAKAHQEASKAARSEAHKKAHADAAKAHQRAATAHRAESITDEAPKKAEPKPTRGDEKKWSRGAAGKLAARRSNEADASSKSAATGGSYEHSDAMFAHQDAENSHKRAAGTTSSESAKKAHLDQAQIHREQADYHRAERHKARAAEEAAKTAPARPDAHGDERDTIFGAHHGAIVAGIHEEMPRAVEAKPKAAQSVRDAIGHLPEPVQKALAHVGVKHESVMTLGEKGTETGHLDGIPRGWGEGSDWSQVGGVHMSGKAYTALGTASDAGGVALHEIGHGVDFAAGEGIRHSDRTWFKRQYNYAMGHEPGSADDRLSSWANDVGRGSGDYFRQPGAAGRQELFAELFRESYRSQQSRDMVDKHFPEYRKNMAKELHEDWSRRGAI